MKLTKHIRWNAYLAILFGLLLAAGETYRRWGEFGHWSRWMDDYIIGISLILPAILVLKGRHQVLTFLIGAWGFAAGLLYGSFFSKVQDLSNIRQSNFEPGLLVSLIGLAFGTAVLALFWTIWIAQKKGATKN